MGFPRRIISIQKSPIPFVAIKFVGIVDKSYVAQCYNLVMEGAKNSKIDSPLYRHINDFLEYCELAKNQSRNTIAAYYRYLHKCLKFALSEGVDDPKKIDLVTVKRYSLYLNRIADDDGRQLKLITQNYHLIALRAFLKYLIKQDIKTLSPEKIELPKNPERQVEFLDREELERLFDATKSEKDETTRLRDYAILETLFSTGLRVSEAASLRRDSINLERREFTVRGKGSKLRLVFLSPEAADAIKKYLAKRKDNNKAIFVGHSVIGQSVEKQIESQSSKKNVDDRKISGLT